MGSTEDNENAVQLDPASYAVLLKSVNLEDAVIQLAFALQVMSRHMHYSFLDAPEDRRVHRNGLKLARKVINEKGRRK